MELPNLFRAPCVTFRALKKTLGKEFEHFKSCDTAGKSYFILGVELCASRYEELLHIVKSYITDIWEVRKSKLYDSGTGLLSIKADQGGTVSARVRVSLVRKLGGGKSCSVVYGSARSSGREVHGPSAMAIILVLLLLF